MKISFKDKETDSAYKAYMREKDRLAQEAAEQAVNKIERLTGILVKTYPQCHKLYKDAQNRVKSRKYAIGGEMLTRGFLCPSPICDIITGNCTRGRMIEKPSKIKKASYEYGYDENNSLITSDCLASDQHEFLIYEDSAALGVVFEYLPNKECNILLLNECVYDKEGRIISFNKGECSENNSICFLTMESYGYDRLSLKNAYTTEISAVGETLSADCTEYKFEYDEKGCLAYYSTEPDMFGNNKFKIPKRKQGK